MRTSWEKVEATGGPRLRSVATPVMKVLSVSGLGFIGFSVLKFRFRVEAFRVQGLGFRV